MTFPERFHMGGLTQCTDKDQPYYLEQIFFSPMDTYNKTGKMEWLQYVY